MFNLLRRSKNKRSKQQNDDDAPKYSANQQNNASTSAAVAATASSGGTSERYRQFSESESEAGLTALRTQVRAPLEELEDLRDLEANDNDASDNDQDDNDDGGAVAALPPRRTFGDVDKIYFERHLQNDALCLYEDEDEYDVEEEKVNLAKTAANFTPNVEASETTTTAAVRDRTSNRKSNSAIKTNNNHHHRETFALGKFDGERESDCDRDALRWFATQSKTSQNEQAEWQGHVSPSTTATTTATTTRTSTDRKIIDKSTERNSSSIGSECFSPPSRLYSSKQFNNSDPTTTTATTATPTSTTAISIAEDAERPVVVVGTTTTTSNINGNRSRGGIADDTVINQVKYRNLGNSQTVKATKTKSSDKEAKRQSRLSLTFGGLNLTTQHGKGKSVAETTATTSSTSSSSSTTTTAAADSKQVKKSAAKRKSFFHNKSKSIDSDQEVIAAKNEQPQQAKRPNSKLYADKDKDAVVEKSVETDRKLGPIQKSREFLSEIFMARGRNHNRNKNQMQQQQQQQPQSSQQQQLQPQEQHSSSSSHQQQQSSLDTRKHVAAVSNHHNDNHFDPAMNNNNTHHDNYAVRRNCSTHLETISDPSSVSTNSYQMTMSNNSSKNFSRVKVDDNKDGDDAERQQRSNSAEHQHHRHNHHHHGNESEREQEDLSAKYLREQRRARSLSQEHCQRAGVYRANSAHNQQEPVVVSPLNGNATEGRYFIHAANTDKNGVPTADSADIAANEEPHSQEQTQSATATINSRERRETVTTNVGGGAAANANCQLRELTECDRDSLLHCAATAKLPPDDDTSSTASATDAASDANIRNLRDACARSNDAALALLMGQTSGKPETQTNSRSSIPREFRESRLPEALQIGRVSEENGGEQTQGIVPTITVVDYSDGDGSGSSSGLGSPVEQEVYYDFENTKQSKRESCGVDITTIEDDEEEDEDDGIEDDNDADNDDDEEHDGSYEQQQQQQQAPSVYQQKWPPRQSRTKLENVIEQEEEDDDDNDDDNDNDDDDNEGTANNAAANLDHEQHPSNIGNGHFDSPERNPLKSANTSDSNLSTSFPDSGIGDSQASPSSSSTSSSSSSSSAHSAKLFRGGDNGIGAENASTFARSGSLHLQQHHHHLPFVRDGNSTDCDETLMQFDDLDYVAEDDVGSLNPNERLVCIESISLPDVVVESTTGAAGSSNTSASGSSAAAGGVGGGGAQAGEHIVNINGATGNSMGSVHFIPIHVESSDGQKRRSVDDSVIGGNRSFAQLNGHHSKPTIEIVEDDSELDIGRSKSFSGIDSTAEKLKRELFEQKASFNVQLEDAQKNVHHLQTKVNEMQANIEKLEQELSTKAWNVERLQGELSAAQTDDDYVRKKLKLLEDEKTLLRHRYSENEDELKKKYEDLDTQYTELQEKYQQTRTLASKLQTQLAAAQSEAEEWRKEVDKIREELEEQVRILRNAVENSEAERRICEDKWQNEFEMLRTQNLETEETLMTDCEWQMRQMQKQCKDKIDKSQHGRLEALEKAEMLENELQERRKEVSDLKVCQAEVKSLRGVVSEQENSIQSLMDQIENLKADLEAANENLEEQIEAVRKIKYQCDNALYDKERQMIYRIDEVRNEAAAFWEDKLYTEMTRLKNELESVYVDERRDALDKLQAEHIEELRALTTRYTANEEELRAELADLQDRFDTKNEEFLELREKSDNALLQTRMHLDRADREFQNAMFREEERREALEESLRKEFEGEKEEMEEKFRERLGQVKDEFARELQISTQEMSEQHHKELAQYKAKLQAERDEAMHELAERHRLKLAAAEEKRKDIELRQQRDLKDLKAAYDAEKTALDKRDISNANEIEQLHRKCRCLTNLFEEMRMRYERRDPRPEDLREIAELRSRCESQERDLYLLTDRLRDMQIQMSELQRNGELNNNNNNNSSNSGKNKSSKQIKKPPPKTIPTNCDVIYEENEERDSPPRPLLTPQNGAADDDEEEEEEEEDEAEDASEDESSSAVPTAVIELNEKKSNNNKLGKIMDNRINEDESHMISAV